MTARPLPAQRLEHLRETARTKRQEYGLSTIGASRATTGFIIVRRNKATDWIGSLEFPDMERPGVFAVSCSGRVFRADGSHWQPVDGGPEWSGDELPLPAESQGRKDAAGLTIPHAEARQLFHVLIDRLLSRGYALNVSFDHYGIGCMVNVQHDSRQDGKPYIFTLSLRLDPEPYLQDDSYTSIHYFHKDDKASVERLSVMDWRHVVGQFCDLLDKSREEYGLQFRTCLPQ
ncbi:hypothetical protein [uncultured Cardiobacterium sp.]|uniref:hypothetical protein n=1 Tax=uncultured Cardiobacterium sp. TaxID=417619 RepID=UPI0026055596|nr:hypothetical protein [uncultured Cardiobacterium sp.]